VVFNRAYKPGANPLFFINGHRIASHPTDKFLGVWLGQKLNWKTHTPEKLFSIIANTKLDPSVKVLTLLYKSLARLDALTPKRSTLSAEQSLE
jgi:hypothetical protein